MKALNKKQQAEYDRLHAEMGIAYVAAWYIDCPYCGEAISAEDGSHLHTQATRIPETETCDCCKKQVKIPKRVREWRK